jgi:hypothetical protein
MPIEAIGFFAGSIGLLFIAGVIGYCKGYIDGHESATNYALNAHKQAQLDAALSPDAEARAALQQPNGPNA